MATVALIQKFKFGKPEGAPGPDMVGTFSIVVSPKPYCAHISIR